MKLKELKDIFNSELGNIYSTEELQTILTYILVDALGIPKVVILAQPQYELSKAQEEQVLSFLKDLKKGIPVQHILGVAHFYGMMLQVCPDVLIPRQETEELVDWVIKDNKGKQLKILDVCTGSGCIALALKMHLPGSAVTAIDVSDKALCMAKKNAENLALEIDFKKADALHMEQDMNNEQYDIIISNPPYIPCSGKDYVQKSVFMYEPHLALFVPDETPLLFYKSIARYAKKTKSKFLYFEIYEELGDEISEFMREEGFSDVIVKKDLNGKNRILRCHYF